MGYKQYKDAYLQPFFDDCSGGLIDNNGDFVQESSCYEWNKGAAPIGKNIQFNNKSAVFIGTLIPHWGHTFTDSFRKIWFLKTSECKRLVERGAEIVYLTLRQPVRPPKYVFDLLLLAGVDLNKCRHITETEQFETIIMPEDCLQLRENGERYWSKEYSDLIHCVVNASTITSDFIYDKIYLTRTQLKDRRDFGEKRIENIFRKEGYQIIAPEKLSIQDQICLYKNSKEIVATEGTVAHNAIFCEPGTKLIILTKADYRNTYQDVVNEVAQLDVTKVKCHHSTFCHPVWRYLGPFYMYVTPELETFLCHKIWHSLYYFDFLYYRYVAYGLLQKMKRAVQSFKW